MAKGKVVSKVGVDKPERERVEAAYALIVECMRINDISVKDGVSAMMNIMVDSFREGDVRERFIKVMAQFARRG